MQKDLNPDKLTLDVFKGSFMIWKQNHQFLDVSSDYFSLSLTFTLMDFIVAFMSFI